MTSLTEGEAPGRQPSWRRLLAADWLDAQRVRVYPRIVVAVYLLAGIGWLATIDGLVDLRGKPLGYDFITFWSAAKLALAGAAEAVYDLQRLFAMQQQAVPDLTNPYAWHYPPTFLLMVLPLAALPYLWACVAWVAASLPLFLVTLRGLTRHPAALWLALAFPGTFINLFHGQNGFLTCALMGGALLLLDRRPLLAGVLFGLMSYKPQFGLLIPLALLATGRWTAFAAAAAAALALAAASFAAFGAEPWRAFLDNGPFLRLVLEQGHLPWFKMPTTFAAARMLGVPVSLSYALQAAVALAVVVVVLRLWRSHADQSLKSAGLVVGALMVSPYGFDYDLVLLALPLAWLGLRGVERGFLFGEKAILLLAWLSPILMPAIASGASLQLGPVVLAALLWSVLRRARHEALLS